MRHLRQVIGVLLLAAPACHLGMTAEKFEPAIEPGAATIVIDIGHRRPRLEAELLAVQDSALLVLDDSIIKLVPLRLIRIAELEERGANATIYHGSLKGRNRERLRLLSRYPQGVTPDLMTHLLSAYSQAAVEVVRE